MRLVLNNVRNKLILRIFACVNKNQKYNENYTLSSVRFRLANNSSEELFFLLI